MAAVASAKQTDPNASCAPCHQDIYERYRHTPMAHASGAAAEGFLPADFVHAASGIHYKVAETGGQVWLEYEREPMDSPASTSRQGASASGAYAELSGRA